MIKHQPHEAVSAVQDLNRLVLDGTKIIWYTDRVAAWERGERIAPITIDMALTRKCSMSCVFCYAALQGNTERLITSEVMGGFLEDSARMGVQGISLVSDGESTLSDAYIFTVQRGAELGIAMASGTNALNLTPGRSEQVLPYLTYLRVNFSAGEPDRYAQIMGVKPQHFHRVADNIRHMVDYKRRHNLPVTLGIQMVLMPQEADQIVPFAKLGRKLGVDYAVIKHCSDDEYGHLGINYGSYAALHDRLLEAEAQSIDTYKCIVKWEKIKAEGKRTYARCYGPPFLIQISGSGLVAPCGMLFNERYAKFHIGNICETRWWDIWQSDRYWEVMRYLGSDQFDARRMCGTLCLQHLVNQTLDNHVKGIQPIIAASGTEPLHKAFV